STSYNTSSDYRLKENVVPLENATSRLKKLLVHKFNFKNAPSIKYDGFLAHEVQEIVPQAVSGEKDEMEEIGNLLDNDNNIIQKDVPKPTKIKENRKWIKTGEKPVYQGMDHSKLVPLLTKALQEALQRIENIENELINFKQKVF